MRRADLAAVVKLLIGVCVTLRTRSQRARSRTKVRALMLGVTIHTTNSPGCVWLDHRRHKRLRVMTRRASLLHIAFERMAVGARAGIRLRGNRWVDAQLRSSMRYCNRRWCERLRVPVSSSN